MDYSIPDDSENKAEDSFQPYNQTSPLASKSFQFATRIVELTRQLQYRVPDQYGLVVSTSPREFVISKQVLRSGTAIGALISEGIYAQSIADFISKMSIALKEAHETQYWLRLLLTTNYKSQEGWTVLISDLDEILKMLTASVRTAKTRLKN